MKLKTTLIFLVIAIAFVVAVFKGESLYKAKQKSAETSIPQKSSSDYLNQMEALSVRDYKGEKVMLSKSALEASDRLVVHFWASWCAPCVNEVPELVAYSKENTAVKFVIVSVDDYQEDIAKFLKSFPDFNSPHYIQIWDGDKQLSKLFNVDRLPMSVIFDRGQNEPKFIRSVVDWKSLK